MDSIKIITEKQNLCEIQKGKNSRAEKEEIYYIKNDYKRYGYYKCYDMIKP